VVEREASLGVVVEKRVVEGAGPLGVRLGHAGDEPDAVLGGYLSESVGGGPGHLDRLLREAREGRLGARVRPPGEVPCPDRRRVGGDEGLGEDHELSARARRLGGALGEALDGRLAVEHDRLDLGAGDRDGAAHEVGSTEKECTLREFRHGPLAGSSGRR
jgi:hypothetical protein